MSSFWWNFHHWLHWKLSFWQLPVQPVMNISSKWRLFRFSERLWSNSNLYSVMLPPTAILVCVLKACCYEVRHSTVIVTGSSYYLLLILNQTGLFLQLRLQPVMIQLVAMTTDMLYDVMIGWGFSWWCFSRLTHWGLKKMAGILQVFSNTFSCIKILAYWVRFHWSLLPRV